MVVVVAQIREIRGDFCAGGCCPVVSLPRSVLFLKLKRLCFGVFLKFCRCGSTREGEKRRALFLFSSRSLEHFLHKKKLETWDLVLLALVAGEFSASPVSSASCPLEVPSLSLSLSRIHTDTLTLITKFRRNRLFISSLYWVLL